MSNMTYLGNHSETLADRAETRTREEERTEAIGAGLAAIAFALLEVAEAIREAGSQHR